MTVPIFTMILSLLIPLNVCAHRVNIFAWVDGNQIHTESTFSGGKKAKHAQVYVYDPQGKELLKGTTDGNGQFSFPIPQKTELTIVLQAGMGHRAQWVLPLEELENIPLPKNILEKTTKPSSKPKKMESIDTQLETAIDKKMAPIVQKLNALLAEKSKPSFSDIMGGIGYILGLMGLSAYIHYRQKLRQISESDNKV